MEYVTWSAVQFEYPKTANNPASGRRKRAALEAVRLRRERWASKENSR